MKNEFCSVNNGAGAKVDTSPEESRVSQQVGVGTYDIRLYY